jgi:hypothetical protein
MHRSLRSIVLAVVLVCATLTGATAFAAPVTWQGVDVTLHSEQSGGVVLINGTLPETAPLPAEAELSVPAGSKIQWIGEILGGPPSADPTLKYTKTTSGGLDVYRFTLVTSRSAQIEILTAGDQAVDGASFSSTLTWTPSQDVPVVRLIVRVPQGAQVAAPVAGASLQPGDSAFSYYVKTFEDVKAGDALDLTFGYSVPATPVSTGGTASGSSTLATIVLLVGALLVVAIVVLAVRAGVAKGSAHTAPELDDEVGIEIETTEDVTQGPPPEAGFVAGDAGRPSSTKRLVLTVAVIAVLIVGVFIVAGQTSKPQLTGDTITKTYSATAPCLTVTIAVTAPADADPRATAETLFAALGPLGGMSIATYNVKTASLEVGFCESQSSESVVRQALVATGLVAAGGGGETPAP